MQRDLAVSMVAVGARVQTAHLDRIAPVVAMLAAVAAVMLAAAVAAMLAVAVAAMLAVAVAVMLAVAADTSKF
jgi:hypothetical protein